MSTQTRQERWTLIVDTISAQIADDLRALDSEERYPGSSPDKSDDLIRDLRKRINFLRQLRQQIEETFAGTAVAP